MQAEHVGYIKRLAKCQNVNNYLGIALIVRIWSEKQDNYLSEQNTHRFYPICQSVNQVYRTHARSATFYSQRHPKIMNSGCSLYLD